MKVKNPLDEFNSYSVHYIILASRSTEDLRPFTDSGSSAQSAALQAIDSCKSLGENVNVNGSTSGVYLVMDTRKFAQFSIENFHINTAIAGFDVKGSSSPNAVGQEMSFTVLDSSGISFANFLQYLMDQKLKVSFDGMTLLVKIVFVGHNVDGTTKTVQSLSVPAIFKTIGVDLNTSRGEYTCECFPLLGAQSNSQYNAKWTSIGTASSYFSGVNSNTLGDVIQSFENRLNDLSMKLYNKFNGVLKSPGQSDSDVKRFGRPVQYMITIPDSWKAFKFSGPSKGGAEEINFQELIKKEESAKTAKSQPTKNAEAKESHIAVDPNLTITEILDVIFQQTLEVLALANFSKNKAQTDTIKFYKHLITITSNDENFTVHVDVVEFVVPNVLLAEKKNGSISPDDSYFEIIPATATSSAKQVPKNFLEYDYIFSGKNIDVLGLDLKIENLNLLLMQGTKIGQGKLFEQSDKGQKQENGTIEEDTSTVNGRGAKDPLLLRTLSAAEKTNFSNLASSVNTEGEKTPQAVAQQYTKNLSDFYNAVGQAKMILRGNPAFLAGIVLDGVPPHVNAISSNNTGGSTANLSVKKTWRSDLETRIQKTDGIKKTGDAFTVVKGASFVSTPVFVKVNVMTQDVDFISLDPANSQQNFAKKLFTDNYYFLSNISSRIEGGRFTQECDMRHFSIYGHKDLTAKGQTDKKVKEVK